LYVEGLIHITELGGEYYRFDEARQELRGERTGVRYGVGARVRVQVSRVDLDTRKIDFRLVREGAEAARNGSGSGAGAAAAPRRKGRGGDKSIERVSAKDWPGEPSAQDELADIREMDREVKRAAKGATKGATKGSGRAASTKTGTKSRERVSVGATVGASRGTPPGKKAPSRGRPGGKR